MRVRKNLERRTGLRDGKIIVIATEGRHTEYEYFSQLDLSDALSGQRFQIEVIPIDDNKSAPNHVIERLSNYSRSYKIKDQDELWMVIDRDRWDVKMLVQIIKECKQKGFGLCISNSCFEIWLILHFRDLSELSKADQTALLTNKNTRWKTASKKMISDLMGNRGLSDYSSLFPLLDKAIINAKFLEEKQSDNILEVLGSQVYKIFEGKL